MGYVEGFIMKTTVRIIRLEEDHNYGTFGTLLINGEIFCTTLEPPDFQNEHGLNSIPAKQYLCSRVISNSWGETFEVRHVPDRFYVFFRPGNHVHGTKNCILLGQCPSKFQGDRAKLNSGATFQRFMDEMKGVTTFHLTIKECF